MKAEKEIVLLDQLVGQEVNISLGMFDYDDEKFVVINAILEEYDDHYVKVLDVSNGNRETLISRDKVVFIAKGWSDDLLKIEKKEKLGRIEK